MLCTFGLKLSKHFRPVTEGPYECEECGTDFTPSWRAIGTSEQVGFSATTVILDLSTLLPDVLPIYEVDIVPLFITLFGPVVMISAL